MGYVKNRMLCLMALAGLLAGACGPGYAKSPEMTGISMHVSNDKTVISVEISQPEGFSVAASTSPNRVIVDFETINFNLPTGAGKEVAGLVTAWRTASVDTDHGRLMLETSAPVTVSRSKLVPGLGAGPAHIEIELAKAEAEAPKPDVPTADTLVTASLSKAAQPTPLATAEMKTIVIDPGHGGGDPGASAPDGVAEKDVVLAFAKTFKTALEATGHYKVVLTREGDLFLPLEQRVKIARDNKADLFLVIHADTLTGPLLQRNQVRGMTLYTVSDKASDAEAEALAQKENRADIIAGVDLGGQTPQISNVLINLAQRESRAEALKFAGRAIAEARSETNITSQPMRSAAFVVLKAPDVASVLIELGYLSNALDEAQLTSDAWRQKMSAAFTRAVDGYFGLPIATAAN
jgi:N-acetylmuramoyl-L-alanine amidase